MTPVPLAHVVVAALELNHPLPSALDRLAALDVDVTPAPPRERGLDGADELMLDASLEGDRLWLDPDEEVPLAHLLLVAERVGRPVRRIVTRLRGLGFRVRPGPSVPRVEGGDNVIVADEAVGVLPADEPVAVLSVLTAAVALARSPGDVAARLRGYRYTVPKVPARLEPDEVALVARLSRRYHTQVLPAEVADLAAETRRSPGWVAEHLRSWGLEVVGLSPTDRDVADTALLADLDPRDPLPLAEVLRRAGVTGQASDDPGAAMRRLRRWGFTLADPTIMVDEA